MNEEQAQFWVDAKVVYRMESHKFSVTPKLSLYCSRNPISIETLIRRTFKVMGTTNGGFRLELQEVKE